MHAPRGDHQPRLRFWTRITAAPTSSATKMAIPTHSSSCATLSVPGGSGPSAPVPMMEEIRSSASGPNIACLRSSLLSAQVFGSRDPLALTPRSTIRRENPSSSPTASHQSDVNASRTGKVGCVVAYVHHEASGHRDGDTPPGHAGLQSRKSQEVIERIASGHGQPLSMTVRRSAFSLLPCPPLSCCRECGVGSSRPPAP
jgi:hypothetical protein